MTTIRRDLVTIGDVTAQLEDVDTTEETPRFTGVDRVLPWVLLIGGLIGAACAIQLTLEKFRYLQDKAYTASCDLNPLISCGTVMNSPQGEAFGFPNPIIGIFGFAVVVTVGVVLLTGATLPDWMWIGLLGGAFFGLAFVHWLAFQTTFVIGALCPYCLAVWIVTVSIFCYTALSVFGDEHFGAPGWLRKPAQWISKAHAAFPIVWLLIIFGVIIGHFWSFWPTMF